MVPKPPQPVRMELNLAPMVDVMMCLIIFFMLATTLVNAENRDLQLPWAVSALVVEKKDLGNRVVINIRPKADNPNEADYLVARMEPVGGGGLALVERSMTIVELNKVLADHARKAAADKEEPRCIIRADEEVMYRHVEVVLRGAGLAKIAKIVFSANSGEKPEDEP